MHKLFKITIIGSSVALRVRPAEPAAKVYGEVLRELYPKYYPDHSVLVENKSESRHLITEVDYFIDRYIRSFPDLFIINIGTVDAPTREIPLWFSDAIFKRSGMYAYHPLKWLHTHVIAKIRRPLVSLRGRRSWVSLRSYLRSMENVVETLRRETNAKVIILGINLGNERVEKALPGTMQRYKEYGSELHTLCQRMSVPFVDVSDLDSETHYPDGVHYNAEGHRVVANRILEVL